MTTIPKTIQADGQTFIINIKSTQNDSWQGTIQWTQTKRTVPFRSALELIKLLDSAVSAEAVESTLFNVI